MARGRLARALAHPALVRRYVGDRLVERLQGGPPSDPGISVLDAEWDTLVLLDACRYDVFEEVNDIPGELSCKRSRGSTTYEFLEENFDGRRATDTVYISANAVVGDCHDYLDVYKLVGLWGDLGDGDHRDDDTNPASLTDPEPVVEEALRANREWPKKRLVVHFLQPHTPFVVKDGEPLPPGSVYRTFQGARAGTVTPEEVRAVYAENVEYVLQYVAQLVAELDGKTVVTADHGELLGEGIPFHLRVAHPRWGVTQLSNFDYGHYGGVRVPELVDVPWLEPEWTERRDIVEAEESLGVEMNEGAIEGQLAALGYK